MLNYLLIASLLNKFKVELLVDSLWGQIPKVYLDVWVQSNVSIRVTHIEIPI